MEHFDAQHKRKKCKHRDGKSIKFISFFVIYNFIVQQLHSLILMYIPFLLISD